MDDGKLERAVQLAIMGALLSSDGQRLRNSIGLALLGLCPDDVLLGIARQSMPANLQTTASPAQSRTAIMPLTD